MPVRDLKTLKKNRLVGWVGSASLRKTGLHFSRLHLTLTNHVICDYLVISPGELPVRDLKTLKKTG